MIYLCNAFSVNMLPAMHVGEGREMKIERISAIEAGSILHENDWQSFFGHEGSAYHLGRYIKTTIPINRGTFKLTPDDVLIVAAVESRRKWESGRRRCPEWRFYRVTIESVVGM